MTVITGVSAADELVAVDVEGILATAAIVGRGSFRHARSGRSRRAAHFTSLFARYLCTRQMGNGIGLMSAGAAR